MFSQRHRGNTRQIGEFLGHQVSWWFRPPSTAGEEKLDDFQHSPITFGPRAGCKNMTSPFQSFLGRFFFFNQLWETPLAAWFCFLQDCTDCLVLQSKRKVICAPSCRVGAPLHPPYIQTHLAHTHQAAPNSASYSRDGNRLPVCVWRASVRDSSWPLQAGDQRPPGLGQRQAPSLQQHGFLPPSEGHKGGGRMLALASCFISLSPKRRIR